MAERTNASGTGEEREVVQLLEERASIEVRDVTTGRVRVATHVETYQDIARAELVSDTVDITRVPVGEPVGNTLPVVRTEGDLTIVPVFEEVLVVEKRLMLKEELHIRRTKAVETVSAPVELRRQTATVERAEPDGETRDR